MGLGAELRRIRISRGMSQREVVRGLGLSAHSNLVDYELGRRIPPSDIVSAYEMLFDVPKGWLEQLRRAALADRAAHIAQPAGGNPVPPRQLPAAVAHFTGRCDVLGRLDALVRDAGPDTPAMVIAALTGTAGVGKTALAVHWGHRAADRFPDGQLYVNLRGFDPGGTPVTPVEALRGFLDGLGVPAGRLPAAPEAQAALYRSLLAGRKILVVLDNARDADHVRPLLPGARGCVAVVTSRDRLSGLVALDGAHPLTVDPFDGDAARSFLAARLGPRRLAAEPGAADEIAARSAGLPLALAIVAARAAVRPDFTLAAFAAELHDTAGGLDGLRGAEPASDVRTVFSWSYRTLSDDAARLFRRLGLHPGPDLTAPAAASLAGAPPDRVGRWLAELADASLLTEPVPGRYAVHDLLRAYAAERVHADDSPADRDATVCRLLDHYLHNGHAAARALDPTREAITPAPAVAGVTPEHPDTRERALSWLAAEHRVILAAVRLAARTGYGRRAWQLAWVPAQYFDRRCHWHDLIDSQRVALDAATRIADRPGQARAHCHLANGYSRLGLLDEARAHYRMAADLCERIGDRAGQAHAHLGTSVALDQQGDRADAIAEARRALDLFRAAGSRTGQAFALNSIGWLHAEHGDHRQAVIYCEEALALHLDLGDPIGAAGAWDSLGYAHHHLGEHARAEGCYREGLDLLRQIGDRYHTAVTLDHLGENHAATGDRAAARDVWREALAILDELQHPDAAEVRAKLVPGSAAGSGGRLL